MKKLTFGILCLGVCACLALSSCSKPEEENTDNAAGDTQNSDLAGIVLPKDEDEEAVVYEYDWSSDGATLIAYNGDFEEVDLDETVIRMKQEKQKKTVTEEVTDKDGNVTTVEKEVEETVEVPVEYTLIGIDAGVFMNNEAVKKITIPDTVTTIGEACFQGCTALEEVKLPEGLTEIGPRTFYGCDALVSLNIPDTVTTIGQFAFGEYFKQTEWYKNLQGTSVIVGDGILLKYNGGANVSYGDEVKKIAYYAFTDSAAQTVRLSDATEEIDALAFYRSSATVEVPEGSEIYNTLRLNNIKVSPYGGGATHAEVTDTGAEDVAPEK